MTSNARSSLSDGFRTVERVAYCIGAQKAGTTWLYKMLRSHPEVHLSRVKEVHYWDTIFPPHLPYYPQNAERNLKALEAMSLPRRLAMKARGTFGGTLADARRYDAMFRHPDPSHAGYRDYLMGEWAGQPVVGDISPGYAMMDAEGFAAMDASVPDARFIFIMRDPVNRLWSNMRHNRKRGFLNDEVKDDLGLAFRRAVETSHPAYQRTDYRRTITELEAVVPKSRIGYFFYEGLFEQEALDRMADFLGISPIQGDISLRVNASTDEETAPPADLAAWARSNLSEIYDFVGARFGEEVPAAWRGGPAQMAS